MPLFVSHDSAPCPPDNINEWVNCENGTMTITWSAVPGAVTYTAMLEEINGGKPSCCTTSESGCEIPGLPCGEMYILHVTAEGRTCNSSESQGLITRTGRHACSSIFFSVSKEKHATLS